MSNLKFYKRQPGKKRVGFLVPETLKQSIKEVAIRHGAPVSKATGEVYLAETMLGLLATGIELYPSLYWNAQNLYVGAYKLQYQLRIPYLLLRSIQGIAADTKQKICFRSNAPEVSGVILSLLHCAVRYGDNSPTSLKKFLDQYDPAMAQEKEELKLAKLEKIEKLRQEIEQLQMSLEID